MSVGAYGKPTRLMLLGGLADGQEIMIRWPASLVYFLPAKPLRPLCSVAEALDEPQHYSLRRHVYRQMFLTAEERAQYALLSGGKDIPIPYQYEGIEG